MFVKVVDADYFFGVAARALIPLIVLGLSACVGAQPEVHGRPAATGPAAEIHATACRPEWCYRDLGQIEYREVPSAAAWDLEHVDATENLKKLAIEKYGDQLDAIIRLRVIKEPRVVGVVVSAEAVRLEQPVTLSCILQRFGSFVINLACDSQREGMIGDAEEYQRIYNSLP